ncbi:hypothetical protein D3C86_954550 [compost metagenome]
MPTMAMDMPRFSGGKASKTMACPTGWMAPPAIPWRMRKKMRLSALHAAPHSMEVTVNRKMAMA